MERKLQSILLIAALFHISSAAAQSFEEFQQWKKQYLNEFEQYKDEIDKEFSAFLKQEWEPFETKQGIVRDKTPKPTIIPVSKPDPVIDKPIPLKKPIISTIPDKLPVTPVVSTPVLPDKIIAPASRKISIHHLGHNLDFYSNIERKSFNSARITQQLIQTEFDRLARSDYEKLISQLTFTKKSLLLDDWAFIRLIIKLSGKINTEKNASSILSWFLLIKNGYKSRVAFSTNEIYLLLSSKQKLYDIQYFTFDAQKFYVISDHQKVSKTLFTYNGAYPKKINPANLTIDHRIKTRNLFNSRVISFNYKGDRYKLKVPVEKSYIDFLSTYPQMDINVYFKAIPSDGVAESLLSQLKPLVENRTQEDAVNFLLKFVQTAFKYKTDHDQFGKENYLFIEETFYYDSSDCEDRSILFAWLVKELLNLDVVGIDFPGHIATAVRLDKPLGQRISYNNAEYTIADPTFINARAGMKMPQYKNTRPRVIPISK